MMKCITCIDRHDRDVYQHIANTVGLLISFITSPYYERRFMVYANCKGPRLGWFFHRITLRK